MRWTVVAGDRREGAAASHLAALGHEVLVFGRPAAPGAASAPDAAAAFAAADAVLGPALGTNEAGDALHRAEPAPALPIDAAWLDLCRPCAPWLIGRSGPWLAAAAAARGLDVLEYGRRDEFATLNAVPTAEGAIGEACRRAGRTAWGSTALVVGGGRCARALVRRLAALDCRVLCAARDPGERAEGRALGAAAAVPLESLPGLAGECDLVFNTVPALVLARPFLAGLPPGAAVADLASAPGGTDFGAAEALGIQAFLLPGLPGRLFPQTAGRIVAEVAAALAAARASGGDGGGRF